MSDRIGPPEPGWLARRASASVAPLAKRLVLSRLRSLEIGELELIEGDGRERVGRPGDRRLRAVVRVLDPRFYPYVALRGSVGAAESYMLGYWECEDLTALIQILAVNSELAGSLNPGPVWLAQPSLRLSHRLRRNTRRGSRRNVAAHYDLGNEFFALFLDPTLTYSCAVFEKPQVTLEQAQIAKYERICRKLALRPEDELLEIGCGWGGFALHAASRHGCRVTTTTISREQYEFTRKQVREAGLENRVTVLQEDYRDLRGRFDKLASIEMIEAVGADYLDTFFRTCSERLCANGTMVLQAILMPDPYYHAARRSVDFIKRYIFPGSTLPSLGVIASSIARKTDLRIVHFEDMAAHYARTLRLWRERFTMNIGRIRAQGFSESFLRMWEFYFCYCEGGFLERTIGVAQISLAKPLCRHGPNTSLQNDVGGGV